HALKRRETIGLPGVVLTITENTEDGRPAEVTFRFDAPLESPEYIWLCFRGQGFEPFELPRVGERTEIPFDWPAILSPRAAVRTRHSVDATPRRRGLLALPTRHATRQRFQPCVRRLPASSRTRHERRLAGAQARPRAGWRAAGEGGDG